MAVPGGSDFTLTINGTNFDSTAVVNWGNTPLTNCGRGQPIFLCFDEI
jgi:hypothetical protein